MWIFWHSNYEFNSQPRQCVLGLSRNEASNNRAVLTIRTRQDIPSNCEFNSWAGKCVLGLCGNRASNNRAVLTISTRCDIPSNCVFNSWPRQCLLGLGRNGASNNLAVLNKEVDKISWDTENGTRTIYPLRLIKGFGSKLPKLTNTW